MAVKEFLERSSHPTQSCRASLRVACPKPSLRNYCYSFPFSEPSQTIACVGG